MSRTRLIVLVASLLCLQYSQKLNAQQFYGAFVVQDFESCDFGFGPYDDACINEHRTIQGYGPYYLDAQFNSRSGGCPQDFGFSVRNFETSQLGVPSFNQLNTRSIRNSFPQLGCPECNNEQGIRQRFQNRQFNNSPYLQPRLNLDRGNADQPPQLTRPLPRSVLEKGLPRNSEQVPNEPVELVPPPQLPPQVDQNTFRHRNMPK